MADFIDELVEWRQTLDDNLRAENSWLALAGLFWLEEGNNSFGTHSDNKIVFPDGSGPDRIGSFVLENDQVTLEILAEIDVLVDGKSTREAVLKPDVSGDPTEIVLNNLSFILIKREDFLGIRLWDNDRLQRKIFPGRQWFKFNEDCIYEGNYQRYETERTLTIQQKNLSSREIQSEGLVQFSISGLDYSLTVFEETDGELFIIFHDSSNGDQTYSAGRYLVTDKPQDGIVSIDFNRAFNPPCAFTPYATCPLPPAQNRLDIPILAGERKPLNK